MSFGKSCQPFKCALKRSVANSALDSIFPQFCGWTGQSTRDQQLVPPHSAAPHKVGQCASAERNRLKGRQFYKDRPYFNSDPQFCCVRPAPHSPCFTSLRNHSSNPGVDFSTGCCILKQWPDGSRAWLRPQYKLSRPLSYSPSPPHQIRRVA